MMEEYNEERAKKISEEGQRIIQKWKDAGLLVMLSNTDPMTGEKIHTEESLEKDAFPIGLRFISKTGGLKWTDDE